MSRRISISPSGVVKNSFQEKVEPTKPLRVRTINESILLNTRNAPEVNIVNEGSPINLSPVMENEMIKTYPSNQKRSVRSYLKNDPLGRFELQVYDKFYNREFTRETLPVAAVERMFSQFHTGLTDPEKFLKQSIQPKRILQNIGYGTRLANFVKNPAGQFIEKAGEYGVKKGLGAVPYVGDYLVEGFELGKGVRDIYKIWEKPEKFQKMLKNPELTWKNVKTFGTGVYKVAKTADKIIKIGKKTKKLQKVGKGVVKSIGKGIKKLF